MAASATFPGPHPPDGTLEPLPDQPRGKINTTDPDSRNVKTPRSYTQGYNAQAVVNEHQIGPALMLCSLEFVGRVGDQGWKLAERLTPIA